MTRDEDKVWLYSILDDEDGWRFAGNTREEAIRQGEANAEGGSFFIAPAWRVKVSEMFPTARVFVEDAADHASDEYGAEDWPDLTNAQGAAFAAEYDALIAKYFPEPACPFTEMIYGQKERIDGSGNKSEGEGR
jgi:hypothetical protein